MTVDMIYNEDCLTGLQRLPDGCIDALVTDPPFAFAGGISNGRSSQVDNQFFCYWWASVCRQLERVLKPDAEGFIWCDWRTAPLIAEGFRPKEQTYNFFRIPQIIYHYREMPGMGRPFRSSVDLIAYLRGPKSKAHRIQNDTQNWISKYWYYGKHKYHPAEKDVGIAEQLVKWCSDENSIVLDPFLGSGTTAVAAIKTNRHYIGFEIDKIFFENAKKRIQNETAQLFS